MFNSVIRIGLEIFLDVFFGTVYNLATLKSATILDIYSDVVVTIWFILLLGLLLWVAIFIVVAKPLYDKKSIEHSKCRVLMEDIKENKKI